MAKKAGQARYYIEKTAGGRCVNTIRKRMIIVLRLWMNVELMLASAAVSL